jgi:hypothetical protein
MDTEPKNKEYTKPKLEIHGNLEKITKAKLGPGEDALSQVSR